MVPADGAKRVSRAETSRHKERTSLLTKAGGDTLCWGWAHNSPSLLGWRVGTAGVPGVPSCDAPSFTPTAPANKKGLSSSPHKP